MGSWRKVEISGRKDGTMEESKDRWRRMGPWREVETNGKKDVIMEGS